MAAPHISRESCAGLFTGMLLAAALILSWAAVALAKPTGRDACLDAAENAARVTGAPLVVLRALALTESGRSKDGQYAPWPWTVNMQGKGVWFDSPDQALHYIEHHYRRGARSFDVGCFQINHKWHGAAFQSISAMMDPGENALYAARFLSELYRETGDWSLAAGAYHSRTPDKAKRYRSRFDSLLRQLLVEAAEPKPNQEASPPARPPKVRRINRYPLLQLSTARRSIGSLVPREPRQHILIDRSGEP